MTKISTNSFITLNNSQKQSNFIAASYVRLRYSVCPAEDFQEYSRLIKKVPDWKEVKRTSGKAECQRLLTVMKKLGLEEIKTQFLVSKNRIFVPISDGQKVMRVEAHKGESLQKLAERLSILLKKRGITIDPKRLTFFRNGEKLEKQNLTIKAVGLSQNESLQAGATLKIRTLTGRSFALSLPFHSSHEDFDAEVCKVEHEVYKDNNEYGMRGRSCYICNGKTLDEEQLLAVEAALWGDRSTPITRMLKLRGD